MEGIHRLPFRTAPVNGQLLGDAQDLWSVDSGAAKKSFKKSLTTKTNETRNRGPLGRKQLPSVLEN